MKKIVIVIIIVTVFLFILLTSCSNKEAESDTGTEARESILDRVIHIQPELITHIPDSFRWCDRLELKKHRIDVGDAELYVEEEGKGMPLVLINGGPGGTHHYFHPWFSRAKDFSRVIYYDQRGCGLSDFDPGKIGYSVKQAVDDLDAIRIALGIKKWVVLGYSYGGFLAQFYTLHYPENLAGLVLLGASPGMWVDTGSSRQGEYISEEENDRIKNVRKDLVALDKEKDLSRQKYTQLLIYNNLLNGDWKRQNFFKPSAEGMGQSALYEWVHDENFNGLLWSSSSKFDLTGAFVKNPIPTLILEGKYDLTWGEKKKDVLKGNHPHAEMVVFENAGHGIYDEETDQFFQTLEGFIQDLVNVSSSDIEVFRASVEEWDRNRKKAPEYKIRSVGWGRNSSKKLVKSYSRDWINKFDSASRFLRVGFAHYDMENYEEALYVFEKMQGFAHSSDDRNYRALALIWQGHMLDLLGNRKEALSRYQKVAEMKITDSWQHGQYGLKYELSPYAEVRIQSPFERIENRDPD